MKSKWKCFYYVNFFLIHLHDVLICLHIVLLLILQEVAFYPFAFFFPKLHACVHYSYAVNILQWF
jgi:hypothetical protein